MDDLNSGDFRLLLSLLKFAIVAPEQRERVQGALEHEMACAEDWENPPPARGNAAQMNSLSFEDVRKMAWRALTQENLLVKGLDETGRERN